MVRRSIWVATLTLVFVCLNSAELGACPIALQVQNKSSFWILEVAYRQLGSNMWNDTSISTNSALHPNDKRIIKWSGDGSYQLEVIYSAAPANPKIIDVQDICTVTQAIILNGQVNIK